MPAHPAYPSDAPPAVAADPVPHPWGAVRPGEVRPEQCAWDASDVVVREQMELWIPEVRPHPEIAASGAGISADLGPAIHPDAALKQALPEMLPRAAEAHCKQDAVPFAA